MTMASHPSPSPYNHPLFKIRVEHLSTDERVALSYKRAKVLVAAHDLSAHDILHCTPKFWGMFSDPLLPVDMAAGTILACHVNLAIGTIARHAEYRNDLQPLMEELLRLDTVGVYLLSERAHGLDAFNIETTATLNEHGFVLNTPREEAAKWVPATTPLFRIPKVGVVFARLIVEREDRGVRSFIVPICNEHQMCRGVTSTRLPPRSGIAPLDFAITNFHNVQLPSSALLGTSLDAPADPSAAWWKEVWRIPIGTASLCGSFIQATKLSAYIGGRYSMWRTIGGKNGVPFPILNFRTQQWPVLQAIVTGFVLDNWFPLVGRDMMDERLDPRVRHGLAVVLKASAGRLSQICLREVAERCGAQGTFEHNFIARVETDVHGALIAEGDVLVLSRRLFAELLLGRYSIPAPNHADTVLWEYASKRLDDCKRLLKTIPGGHRSDLVDRLLLPHAERIIAAFGYALAYSAALDAGISQHLLDLFECIVLRVTRPASEEQSKLEDRVVCQALPHLEEYLTQLNVAQYDTAPIVSDQRWKEYLSTLRTFRGSADTTEILDVVSKLQARL